MKREQEGSCAVEKKFGISLQFRIKHKPEEVFGAKIVPQTGEGGGVRRPGPGWHTVPRNRTWGDRKHGVPFASVCILTNYIVFERKNTTRIFSPLFCNKNILNRAPWSWDWGLPDGRVLPRFLCSDVGPNLWGEQLSVCGPAIV